LFESRNFAGCTQESLSVTALSNNQLSATGYTYDASGNMLTDGRNTYTWNAENQLKTAAGVTYTYDGDGHRVEKSNGKLYWYGTGSDPLMETDLSGNLTYEYIFFGGKRIARRDSSNNVVYYAADHLGTSRVVASSAGAILDQSDFYPFGGERVLSASSGNTYKFTSKERDTESNLDNFGARYDSSILGRFMSPDPIHLMKEKLTDPQQWNMYSYVRNSPLKMVDANGKWPTDIHNQIIDKAFPGLSDHERSVLKSASASMDHCLSCQLEKNSYKHSMRAPDEKPEVAKEKTQNFVKTEEHEAQVDQKGTPTNALDINDKSLSAFGEAAHTLSDGTSPAHVDPQGNPLPWDPYSYSEVQAHDAAEATITPEQMNNAVNILQQAFQATYGEAAAKQAAAPPAQPLK